MEAKRSIFYREAVFESSTMAHSFVKVENRDKVLLLPLSGFPALTVGQELPTHNLAPSLRWAYAVRTVNIHLVQPSDLRLREVQTLPLANGRHEDSLKPDFFLS